MTLQTEMICMRLLQFNGQRCPLAEFIRNATEETCKVKFSNLNLSKICSGDDTGSGADPETQRGSREPFSMVLAKSKSLPSDW